MLGTLLIFTTTPSTTVHASNDTLQPFYNNPLNPNPDAIYTGGGVEYFFRYAAIDNITGNRAYSSTNWNTNSTINWYTTVPNNSDIYNRDYAHDLALCGQLNNVTTTDANVNIKLQLPYYPSRTLVPDPDRLTSNPTTGTYSSTLRGHTILQQETIRMMKFRLFQVLIGQQLLPLISMVLSMLAKH